MTSQIWEQTIQILLFGVPHQERLAEALGDLNARLVIESSHTPEGFASALESRVWDAVLTMYPPAPELLARVQEKHLPCIILYQPKHEAEALALQHSAISDILPVINLKRLPFIVRRELRRSVQQDHQNDFSEGRFQHLADTAPSILWVTDNTGSSTFLSRGWYEFTGQAEGAALKFAWLDAVHPEDKERSREIFLDALEKRAPFQLDYRLRRHDGEYRWAIDAGRPDISPSGELLGYVGSVIDIHERKLVEAELQERELWLRLSLEASGLGTWHRNFELSTIYLDERAQAHYGFDTAIVTPQELLERVHPDDIDRLKTELDAAFSPNGSGNRAIEYRVIHPDGTLKWLAVLSRIGFVGVGDERYPLLNFGTSQDITEAKLIQEALQRSEERYRRVLEDQSEMVWRTDADFRLTYVNSAFARFHQQSPDALLGKSLFELLPDENREVLQDHFAKLNAAYPAETMEHPVVMPNQPMQWLQWRDQVLLDESGKIIEYQGVGRDITKRKAAERELQALYNATSYLFKSDSLMNLSNQIVQAVVQEFQKVDCGLMLIDHQQNKIIRLARTGEYNIHPEAQLTLDGLGLVPLAARTGKSVYIPDVSIEAQYLPNAAQTRSELVIPLITSKGVIAVLDLQHAEANAFSESDQRILSTYAERAAAAIETVQLYEEINQHAAELEARVAERTTELNETKERVEAILNSSPDGILMTNARFRIKQTNFAFDDLFEAEPDTYYDQPLTALVHPEDAELVRRTATEVLLGQVRQNIEVRAQCSDGNLFSAELSIGHSGSNQHSEPNLVCTIRDVTARKEADEALQKNAAEIADLYNNAPVGYHSVNAQGYYEQINDTELRWLGYTRHEIIGKVKITDLITPDSLQRIQPHFDFLVEQGWLKDVEIDLVRKDGSILTVLVSSSAAYDKDGNFLRSRSTFYDITELKQAENALHLKIREEQEFQRYFKILHEVTIELTEVDDLDTFFRRAVELGLQAFKFERLALFLYNPEDGTASGTYGTDIEGQLTDEHHVRFIPPADGRMMKAMQQTERFSFSEEEPLFTAIEAAGTGWHVAAVLWNGVNTLGWLTADNAIHHTPYSKPMLDIISLYALTLGSLMARKKTEVALRENEARYRMLAENITDLVIRLNPQAYFTYMSPSSKRVLGYEPEELDGKFSFPIIHPDDLHQAKEAARIATEQRRPYESLPIRFQHKAGHYVWLEMSGQAVFSEETGELSGFITSSRDMTERKIAADALRESEQKFRLLVDAAPVAIVITDETGAITLANSQAESLFGYNPGELLGQRVEILLPAQFRQTHIQDRLAYVHKPKIRPMGIGRELFAQHKAGNQIPVEIELSFIETHAGLLIMSFIVDITERKERERQLRFHASLQENVTDAVIATNLNYEIQSWNPAAERIYGWKAEEVLGKYSAEILRTEYHNDTSNERVAEHFLEQGFWTNEIIQHHKDGTPIDILCSVVLFKDDNGTPIGIVAVNHDITERKAQERELRYHASLQENVTDAVIATNLKYEIQSWNPAAERLYGWTPPEVIGRPSPEILRTEFTNNDTRESVTKAFLEHGFLTREVIHRHKDGHPIYVLSSIVIFKDEHGQPMGIVSVNHDITKRRQAEEALQQALQKEKELGELKSRFVSMASHEFRTPLASILALTETLRAYRHKLPDEQIDSRLSKIQDQIAHLKDIMEDVLQLARLQARRTEFNPTRINLDAVCRSVLDEFQNRPDITHQLDYTCDNALQEVVLDRKLMRQIITNLVSNAIKYSPPKENITIYLGHHDDMLILKIGDKGIGIPESDLHHLFEPFHRATNVETISGTGLGLTITKEAVEMHRGTIMVDSEVNIGTTFTIEIPIGAETRHDKNPGD